MEHLLLGHYRKNNGSYCLDFAFSSLEDLFERQDPSPLHERDLNSQFASQLFEQIIFFPENEKVQLIIHLPKKLEKAEMDIRHAIHHHFEFEYLDSQLHLSRRVLKARKILFVAFCIFIGLISLSFFVKTYAAGSVWWSIVSESLFVGSWVTLWHPVHLLLYEWIPLQENKKVYKRLMDIEVQFVYT